MSTRRSVVNWALELSAVGVKRADLEWTWKNFNSSALLIAVNDRHSNDSSVDMFFVTNVVRQASQKWELVACDYWFDNIADKLVWL